jgi:hypothetical protein
MKKVLWVLSSLALVGMGFVGCDDDEDACNNDCEDNQICAPLSTGTSECVDKAKILDKCKADDAKSLKNCYVLKKDGDDYRCIIDEVKCTNYCYGDSDCSSGSSCDTASHTCKAGASTDYKYIRIDDLTPASETAGKSDPGVDLDAIVLVKAGGSQKYVKDVKQYKRGDNKTGNDAKVFAGDEKKIVGAPDSLTAYGTDGATCKYFQDSSNSKGDSKCDPDKYGQSGYGTKADGTACDYSYTFVSLGGVGGYIVVEMEDKLEVGDQLDIVEVGNCKLVNTASGSEIAASRVGAENMEVRVSVSNDNADTFKAIAAIKSGNASKGVFSFKIESDMLK